MAARRVPLTGVDWQNWANQLLGRRYGPAEYQKVPDKHRGDAGVEGFTITLGHAYQAYGCDEPISVAKRYENQRDKITADIGKFISNRTVLATVFGTVSITRWVLLVPSYDSSDLVAHAAKKTTEVLEASLPYVHSTFRVMISDEDEFEVERDSLINAGCSTLSISVDQATNDQIAAWRDQNDTLLESLDGKIRKLPTIRSETERVKFRDQLLKWFLEGQDIFTALRKHPTTYEKVVKAKSLKENYLASTTMLAQGSSSEVLQVALRQFKETVAQEVREISPLAVEALAHEAVSDWMIRCPLDFPGAADHE